MFGVIIDMLGVLFGVFAVVITGHHDCAVVQWDKGDKRPELMNFASYFGCAASATMCLMTCFVHIYLRY